MSLYTQEQHIQALHAAISQNDGCYITKKRVQKLILKTDWSDKDYLSKECPNPKRELRDRLATDVNLEKLLCEYEFDRWYKYCTLYRCPNVNLDKVLQILKKNKVVNDSQNDVLTDYFFKPTLLDFGDSFDLKFNLALGDVLLKYKYPVVLTFFRKTNLVAFKYHVATGVLKDNEEAKFYSKLNLKAFDWLKRNISKETIGVDALAAYKKLFLECQDNNGSIEKSIEPYSIASDDLSGGKTALRIAQDSTLPLIDSIIKLSDDFLNEQDKDLLKEHIKKFLKDSKYHKIGLTWSSKFDDSRGQMASIIATIEKKEHAKVSELKSFQQIHFHSRKSINRTRLNYVINGISEYL